MNLEFTSIELSKIIRAANQTQVLKFSDCKILSGSKFELGYMDKCKIIHMRLYRLSVHGDKDINKKIMVSILQAILNCFSLLKSLKYLDLCWKFNLSAELKQKAKEISGERYNEIINKLNFN